MQTTSDDPLEVAFTPALLAALDERMENKIRELLEIADELDGEPIEVIA